MMHTIDFQMTEQGARKQKTSSKKRCSYNPKPCTMEPYWKKPRIIRSAFVSHDDQHHFIVSESHCNTEAYKCLWMAWLSSNKERNIIMWVGWNPQFLQRREKIQKVMVFPQLNESPTSHSVVLETMKSA